MQVNEKQLIKQILEGETSSFSYFVDTYQDMAFTLAFRICANRQDAEDITQNAFVKAFHNLHTFRATSKFSSWFYRIVYHTALNFIKQNQLKTVEVDENTGVSEENNATLIEKEENLNRLEVALNQLPKDEVTIVTLYYLDEKPIKEIAEVVGLTESNVKIKLHRSRQKLKEYLTVE